MVVRFFTSIGRLFSSERQRQFGRAVSLYDAVVAQARTPGFYTDLGVADDVEGRFDLLTLHAGLLMRRLGAAGDSGAKMAQTLFDVMFLNMDDSLREMGVGDLKVGNKVRELAEAFYGRLAAYEAALGRPDEAARREALCAALSRNIYGRDEAGAEGAVMTAYALALADALGRQDDEALLAGAVQFPPVPPLDLSAEREKAASP